MENKLKKIEDFVLEDTVKYFDAQEGKENEKFTFFFVIHQFPISHHYFFLMLINSADNLSPSEERLVKNRLAQRMATAYSLEKLRKAVEKLRESTALGNNFLEDIYSDEQKKRKSKRVAVKKEKVEFDNNE